MLNARRRRARRVLVVDDDQDLCDALRLLLEHTCEVAVAYDGVAALAEVALAAPDVVLFDLEMPRCGGEALHRNLVALGDRVPRLILMSGSLRAPDWARDRGLELLRKPFDVADVLALLHLQ